MRVKNKHTNGKLTGSPSVLINVELGLPTGKQIGEIQLYLDEFLSLKGAAHLTYEITRAGSFMDVLKPPLYGSPFHLVDTIDAPLDSEDRPNPSPEVLMTNVLPCAPTHSSHDVA